MKSKQLLVNSDQVSFVRDIDSIIMSLDSMLDIDYLLNASKTEDNLDEVADEDILEVEYLYTDLSDDKCKAFEVFSDGTHWWN